MTENRNVLHYFNAPTSCHLGKRVYKRLFYENAKLTAYDKKILKEDVETVCWQLSFKPTTIPIQPYKDERREYLEVALVEIALHGKNRISRLSELVHRAIPYPLILMCTFEDEACFSSADKRFSEAERDVVVAEEVRLSDWIDLSGPSAVQAEFLKSLDVTGWSYTNFRTFYNSFINRLLALESAAYTGSFSLDSGMGRDERVSLLSECRQIEEHIKSLRNAIKNEDHFNRQVEMNATIKELESQLEELVARL